MKKILLLSLSLLFFLQSIAQYLQVNIKLNECVSCYSSLTFLNPTKTGIPVFAVFKESYQEDSAAIEYKLKLRMFNIPTIYSTKMYKNVFDSTSSVSFYDRNGQLCWQKPLKTIKSSFADTLRSQPNLYWEGLGHGCFWNNDYLYKFSYDLGILKAYDRSNKRILFEIIPSKTLLDSVVVKMTKQQKYYFQQVKTLLNEKSNIAPSYQWFQIDNQGNLFLGYKCLTVSYDSISKNISDKDIYSLVKFSASGQLILVTPVEEYNPKMNPNLSLYMCVFKVIDSDNFISVTHDWKNWVYEILEKKPDSTPIYTVTQFSTRDRKYYPAKYIPVDIPYANRKKYFDNHLSVVYCNYPLISFGFGNNLYNAENTATTTIVDDEQYRQSVSLDKEAEHATFAIVATIADKQSQNFYVFYRWKGQYLLNRYSWELKLEKSTPIQSILKFDGAIWAEFDLSHRLVYMVSKAGEQRTALPLDIF